MQVPRSHELFACLSNPPLSLPTGLADGLALKDRATRRGGRDSPQQVGPPISVLLSGRRFSGSARGTLAKDRTTSSITRDSEVRPRGFAAHEIAHPSTATGLLLGSACGAPSHKLRRCQAPW